MITFLCLWRRVSKCREARHAATHALYTSSVDMTCLPLAGERLYWVISSQSFSCPEARVSLCSVFLIEGFRAVFLIRINFIRIRIHNFSRLNMIWIRIRSSQRNLQTWRLYGCRTGTRKFPTLSGVNKVVCTRVAVQRLYCKKDGLTINYI